MSVCITSRELSEADTGIPIPESTMPHRPLLPGTPHNRLRLELIEAHSPLTGTIPPIHPSGGSPATESDVIDSDGTNPSTVPAFANDAPTTGTRSPRGRALRHWDRGHHPHGDRVLGS
jgi:hypothetical protein